MKQHITNALSLRPIRQTSPGSLRGMIVDAVARDGFPNVLHGNRWTDEAYAHANSNSEETGNAVVCIFSVNEQGNSFMLVVEGYRPWIRVEMPEMWTRNDAEKLKRKFEDKFGVVELKIENLKRFYGFIPDKDKTKQFRYAKYSFNTWKAANIASRIVQNDNLSLVDKQVKPIARFFHDNDFNFSEWISVSAERIDTSLSRMSNCQMEYSCQLSQIKKFASDSIAPLLTMSFDGEMYSKDGSFPSVLKGDNTIYLGASFWTYGTPISEIKRFMMCVGDVDPVDGITMVSFPTTREMIEGFRDMVIAADPDIITGWNIYGFDFPFLHSDYSVRFSLPDMRGSEQLQISAMQLARSAIGLEEAKVQTAAQMLASLRKRGSVKDWIEKAERMFSTRHVKKLQSLEKHVENQSSLVSYGVTEADDDEDMDGLPADIAHRMRMSLREQLLGSMEAAKRTSVTFRTLLSNANDDQISSFWNQMEKTHGSYICEMLQYPAAPSGAKRGLFYSRFACEQSELSEKRMSNAAKGDNTYYFWSMTGRILVDLMQVMKDDKKPDDNTLKFAAESWLTDSAKIDLSATDMFALYATNDAKKRSTIVEYCARDCDIPLRLIAKLSYIPVWIEMSRVCYTRSNEVINSGQQVKVFNLIARFVWNEYAINVRDSGWPTNDYASYDEEDDYSKRKPDYQGATVIEPVVGFYEDCISTLDFESLYPSIIRYFNLCPSVLVLDNANVPKETHAIQHNIFTGMIGKEPQYRIEERKYTFATHVQGVLPRLLKRLIDARKSVKKLMAIETDPLQKAILNGRQNGIKVACNSVYGFCGVAADRGLLPCKPVAAVTTLKGRQFIEAAKQFVESNYLGSKVIYGDTDSVMIFWGKDVDVPEAARRGEEAAENITILLRSGSVVGLGGAGSTVEESHTKEACSAVTLAYEKTYRPYLLLKKKNYAGLKYTQFGSEFKTEIDMKGIDAVRRDRPKLLRDTSNAVLKALLFDRSVPQALSALKFSLDSIAQGNTVFEDFILSKSLKSHYANENLPHLAAWKRMGIRGDEDIPPIGARMQYVVCLDKAGCGGKTKLYERSEHPAYVKTASLKVDRQYYLETLKNPIIKLLQFVTSEEELKVLFKTAIERATLKASNISSLRSFAPSEEDVVLLPKKRQASISSSSLRLFMSASN